MGFFRDAVKAARSNIDDYDFIENWGEKESKRLLKDIEFYEAKRVKKIREEFNNEIELVASLAIESGAFIFYKVASIEKSSFNVRLIDQTSGGLKFVDTTSPLARGVIEIVVDMTILDGIFAMFK